MHLITPGRAETRTISIGAPPAQVFDYLSDAAHLPAWAPAFATSVTHEHGDVWRVQTAAGERRAAIRAARTQGVVDIVSPDAPDRGLFARVIPNLAGSELIFTLPFPEGTPRAAIDAQMETIEQELASVRRHFEPDADARATVAPARGRGGVLHD